MYLFMYEHRIHISGQSVEVSIRFLSQMTFSISSYYPAGYHYDNMTDRISFVGHITIEIQLGSTVR